MRKSRTNVSGIRQIIIKVLGRFQDDREQIENLRKCRKKMLTTIPLKKYVK